MRYGAEAALGASVTSVSAYRSLLSFHRFPSITATYFYMARQRSTSTLARKCRELSLAVTIWMYELFQNMIMPPATLKLDLFRLISLRNNAERGISSFSILSITSYACARVFDVTTIFEPGYRIALMQQKTAIINDLPISFVIPQAFYPVVLAVTCKLSIYFHPRRCGGVAGTRGSIIVSFEDQPLCVTVSGSL